MKFTIGPRKRNQGVPLPVSVVTKIPVNCKRPDIFCHGEIIPCKRDADHRFNCWLQFDDMWLKIGSCLTYSYESVQSYNDDD